MRVTSLLVEGKSGHSQGSHFVLQKGGSMVVAGLNRHCYAASALGLLVLIFEVGAICPALGVTAGSRGADAVANPANASQSADQAALDEAVRWLKDPPKFDGQYNYVMTVRIRLLFFWISKDDVGGGYINVGAAANDPNLEVIELLFGSDPAKAKGINRWGAGTEVLRRAAAGGQEGEASAFLGFMKSSEGQSVSAMQKELSNEKKQGQHRFEAIISRVDHDRAISTTVPFYSPTDFDLGQLPQAQSLVMKELSGGQQRNFHRVEGPGLTCTSARGFLSTMEELIQQSLSGAKMPASLCYVYNARQYTATLEGSSPVAQRSIHVVMRDGRKELNHTYRDVEEARFQILNHESGKRSNFTLLVGKSGAERGVPVQINYQPNWWFQIVLNFKPRP